MQQKTIGKKIVQSLLFVSIAFAFPANALSQANIPVPVSTNSLRKANPGLDKPDKNGIYQVIDKMPQYPGGEKALLDYIGQNLKYPVDAQEKGIQGRIVVRFVVTKFGKVENVEIVRGLYPSMDKEGVRMVSSLPDWIPGEQKGQKVSVYYTVPITFKLDGGDSKPKAIDPAKRPLIILDGNIVPKDYNFSTLNKDSFHIVGIVKTDQKEKLDEVALKYNAYTSNGVVFIESKQYTRQHASEKVKTTDAKPKVIEDKDINFDNFKIGEIPLFIIDGKVSTQTEASNLNKKDIQEIKVLKNEKATSLYGEKGKNGVIIIVSKAYVSQHAPEKAPALVAWDVADKMPQFPGGEKALMNFISRNLRYPIEAMQRGIQGRVILRFLVTTTGKIEKIEVVKSVSRVLDNEAIRIVQSLPDWIPGEQKGEKVNVYYTLPITYRLQ
jgi:TonB family protein